MRLRLHVATRGRVRTIAWGFLDQAFSSATNFGLSVLAGRLLGPEGLGRVFLAFSVYLIVLMLQRLLVTEPLLVITSALDPERRVPTARLGLTLSLLIGLAATLIVLILGVAIRGLVGAAFLLIGPWLVPLLVQDFWRNLLFRERRASASVVNDAAWFVVMAAALPLAWVFKAEWAVIMVWAAGAVAGALLGFFQTRLRPSASQAAWVWWSNEARRFATWNAGAEIAATLVGRGVGTFGLAAIVGTSALGGFQAVMSLFAPLSLITPALSLPGLPAIARAYAAGFPRARDLASLISGIAVAAALAFFAVILLGGWRLLPFLFTRSFLGYRSIVLPIALGQVALAASVGFPLLVKVEQRGRLLFVWRLGSTLIGVALSLILAWRYGLAGAAWAYAVGTALATITLAVPALREPRATPSPGRTQDVDLATKGGID